MHAKNKQYNLTEVRFRVLKGTKAHEAVLFFEKNYKLATRSKTVRQVLMELKLLFDFFSVRTFEGLIKKIGIKMITDSKDASFKCTADFETRKYYNSDLPEESKNNNEEGVK